MKNIMNTCNDNKNFTNIPTSWLKCGEVFYNSMEKPIFVCSICLRNADGINTAYTTYDGSVFWWHIQQQHISQEFETIDKISAEIESFESTHLDFGGDKVKQNQVNLLEKFHDKLVEAVAKTTTATEENKDILQNLDIKVEHEQIHENILPPDEKKVDTAISNFSECNYYYDENETCLISDDEDELNEGAEDQEYPIIIGNYVRDYLRHNDMVVISDDDEDNVTTRPSSPISIAENTKINEDCEKTPVENNKYTDFKKIGENILPQTNILSGILTPDVSPCESLTSQQYDKRYTICDKDVQGRQSHTMDASHCESPTAQQYNKDVQEKQVCTPDVSPSESLTAQQYNKIHYEYNEGIQEKKVHPLYVPHAELQSRPQQYNSNSSAQDESAQEQRVPTPGISCYKSLTSIQKDNTHSGYHKDAQAKRIDSMDVSPCGSLRAQQYNNTYYAQNESVQEQRVPTPNVSPCETITPQHYVNRYTAYTGYIQEQRVSPCRSLTTQQYNGSYAAQNESTQEQRVPTPGASLYESLTSQQKDNTHSVYNKSRQDNLTSQQKDNTHSLYNNEDQGKPVDTLDVPAYGSPVTQHYNNGYCTQNKSDQERRVPTPNVSSCNSFTAQHYNKIYTPYAKNLQEQRASPCGSLTSPQHNAQNESTQEQRVPTPGASLCERLTSQQKDNSHSGYNKDTQQKRTDTLDMSPYGTYTQNERAQEQPVTMPNVSSGESLTTQYYNKRYNAHIENVKDQRMPQKIPTLITQQCSNNYAAQNGSAQEKRAVAPQVSPYESLIREDFNKRYGAYAEYVQEQRVHAPHVFPCVPLTAQQANNRYSACIGNTQEQILHRPHVSPGEFLIPQHYNNTFTAYSENVRENLVHTHHEPPCESLLAQQYNSYFAYNANSQGKKKRSARSREFQCKVCGRRMISKEKMEIHMSKFHKSVLNQPDINHNIHNHQHQHKMHKSLKNKNNDSLENNGINCKICKRKTKTVKAMERHQNIYHSSETSFLVPECPICHIRVLRKKLEQHMESHFGTGFNCSYCGFVCKQKHDLDKHIRLCHEDTNTNSVAANLQQVTTINMATRSYEEHQFRNQEYGQTWRYHMNFNNVIPPQNPQS